MNAEMYRRSPELTCTYTSRAVSSLIASHTVIRNNYFTTIKVIRVEMSTSAKAEFASNAEVPMVAMRVANCFILVFDLVELQLFFFLNSDCGYFNCNVF